MCVHVLATYYCYKFVSTGCQLLTDGACQINSKNLELKFIARCTLWNSRITSCIPNVSFWSSNEIHLHAHSIQTVFYVLFSRAVEANTHLICCVFFSYSHSLSNTVSNSSVFGNYCQFISKICVVAIAFTTGAATIAVIVVVVVFPTTTNLHRMKKWIYPYILFLVASTVHFRFFSLYLTIIVFHWLLLASSIALIRFSISTIYLIRHMIRDTPQWSQYIVFVFACNLFCRTHSMLAILDNCQRKQMKKAKAIRRIMNKTNIESIPYKISKHTSHCSRNNFSILRFSCVRICTQFYFVLQYNSRHLSFIFLFFFGDEKKTRKWIYQLKCILLANHFIFFWIIVIFGIGVAGMVKW